MPGDPLRLEGTTIADKYRLDACVGVGGFAAVYKAMHLTWQRAVAVKVFRELDRMTPGARETLVQNLVQEASVLAELSERDATICQARDVGTLTTADGRWHPYLVLEWLEGTSLERVIKNERASGRPPRGVAETVAFLTPIARALTVAHKRGVAHRDIKPANVFVMGDPRGDHTVKLLDFGIAKVVTDLQDSQEAFSETQGVGSSYTPTYAAPEQFSRKYGATGPWTDVYALALMFTELVSGRPPMEGETVAELAFVAIDTTLRPTPRTRGALVSDAVENVIAGALSVDPRARYQTVTDFWTVLTQVAGDARTGLAFAATEAPSARVAPSAGMMMSGIGAMSGTGNSGVMSAPPSMMPGMPGMPSAAPSAPGPVTGEPHMIRVPPANGGMGGRIAIALGVASALLLSIGGGAYVLRKRMHSDANAASSASASLVMNAPSAPSALVPPVFVCPADMVMVPAGKFFMGSDDKSDYSFEKPAHQVSLGAYCIDRLEVSAAQYKACSEHGECKRAIDSNDWEGLGDRERKIFDPLCNVNEPTRQNHPMNCIDWRMSRAYCKAQKKRLPTEAEWEHAARGSDGRRYPWGDDLPTAAHLNACGLECVAWGKRVGQEEHPMYQASDGFENTSPVGSFPAGKTVFGAEDMVGNVWEWVYDNYAPYSEGAEVDPRGPAKGEDRVIRGGAWNGTDPSWVRPTFRYHDVPTKRSYGIGFRCAESADNDG